MSAERKVVPREPTQEQVAAAVLVMSVTGGDLWADCAAMWRQMWEAAPAAPAPEPCEHDWTQHDFSQSGVAICVRCGQTKESMNAKPGQKMATSAEVAPAASASGLTERLRERKEFLLGSDNESCELFDRAADELDRLARNIETIQAQRHADVAALQRELATTQLTLANLHRAAAGLLTRAERAEAAPTMEDAVAAGDGTLHRAIDYWQGQARRAKAAEHDAWQEVKDAEAERDETKKDAGRWVYFRDEMDHSDKLRMIAKGTDHYDAIIDAFLARADAKEGQS